MWDYTGKVLDHFRNPRNVGRVDEANATGEVGSLACGDALVLTLKIDDNRITDAKFQTFGCASAIASSSALTEMIKGMTVEQAELVTNQDIAQFLGGLPEQKMHCSVMGREALDVAIDNYRTGSTAKKILEGTVTCSCFGVTEEEVLRAVRENNLTTIEQVTNYTKAGGGCETCHGDIETLLTQVRAEREAEAAKQKARPRKMTILQKVRLIEETMQREIRPLLRKDGGDVELIDVDGDRVIISFRGMCARCSVAPFTMNDVVQAKLREFVSEDLVVEEERL